jgi:hypothetical protein
MNPILNRIRFFRAVETVIAAVRPDLLHLEERRVYAARHGGGGSEDGSGIGQPRPF